MFSFIVPGMIQETWGEKDILPLCLILPCEGSNSPIINIRREVWKNINSWINISEICTTKRNVEQSESHSAKPLKWHICLIKSVTVSNDLVHTALREDFHDMCDSERPLI